MILCWVFNDLAKLQTPDLTNRFIFPAAFMAVPVGQLVLYMAGAWTVDVTKAPSARRILWTRSLNRMVRAVNYCMSFALATLIGGLYGILTGPLGSGTSTAQLEDVVRAYMIGVVTLLAAQYLGWVVASREMHAAETMITHYEERKRFEKLLAEPYGINPGTNMSGVDAQWAVEVDRRLNEVTARLEGLNKPHPTILAHVRQWVRVFQRSPRTAHARAT